VTLNRRAHLLIALIGTLAVTIGAAGLYKGLEYRLERDHPTIEEPTGPLPPRGRLDLSHTPEKTDAVQPIAHSRLPSAPVSPPPPIPAPAP
jgi:hypothetical protein